MRGLITRHARRLAAVAAVLAGGLVLLAGQRTPASPDPDMALRPHRLPMVGVNLAGGEFGDAAADPLVIGRDYIYPDAAVAAPFLAAGMTTVRLPIRWENVQHAPFARLDAAEMGRIDTALAALAGFRWVILDIHNGALFEGKRLTDDTRSAAMLADLWRQLADRYKARPAIAFGLMNEPVGISAAAWRRLAEASLAAIRRTGARNLVLVPGIDWTGAHSWMASNAAAMSGFRDPGGNFAFELHQYLDSDSSGTHPACVGRAEAIDRMRAATAWLEAQHARGFLGEFGSGPLPSCLDALDGMLGHLDRHPGAWLGWSVWAAGGWWGAYPFSVQPDGNRDKPQMAVLMRHVPFPADPERDAGFIPLDSGAPARK